MINPPTNRLKIRNKRYAFLLLIALFLVTSYLISSASTDSILASSGQKFFKFTPVSGTITIAKQTIPDDDPTLFSFVGDRSTTLPGGQSATFTVLAPESYSITENLPGAWKLIDISCNDNDSVGDVSTRTATFNVANSELVTCTFTNEKWADFEVFLPTIR